MNKTELEALRKQIDRIDDELVKLLNERAEVVRNIYRIKENSELPAFDPARERKIITRIRKLNRGPLSDQDVESIMHEIFKVYRSLFKPLTIAYFGPAGTFTHQAALHQFGEKNIYTSCRTIEYVFRQVEERNADYGVVPVENSNEGIVTHTLDMFVDSNLKIAAEIIIKIHHCLLSRESTIKKIKKVYSHPQAFAQCKRWIEENLPSAMLIETESTAYAVNLASKKPGTAAIGSSAAAILYKMKIIASNIEDYRGNVTRFLVIGRTDSLPTNDDKTSVMFSVKDRVGALHDMLVPFKKHGINLTRIESRPTKKKAWEYIFFIDFMGHKDDANVRKALKELERNCTFLKILGSYPRGNENDS
ncbi:MAG: prephenate dehydratase [Candidatus Omnitrophica bacterium]|nr:prephenate dehydratase [Candidatus Omnitrophota bacterium]MCM8824707.1 prephenate dehydratase [Candidatus Omnitrophota bacterium]